MKSYRIWIAIAALLILFSVLFFGIRQRDRAYSDALLEAKERVEILNAELKVKESALVHLETEYIKATDMPYRVTMALFVDQITENLYEKIYPRLKAAGFSGVMVLHDGILPGDEGMMSKEECSEMLEDGWELAIGGSEEIDLVSGGEEVLRRFESYLEEVLLEAERAGYGRPTIYCFSPGEYQKEYLEILLRHGFTMARYFGEGESTSIAVSGVHDGGIYLLRSAMLVNGNTVFGALYESANAQKGSFAVSMNEYDEALGDYEIDRENFGTFKMEQMLKMLGVYVKQNFASVGNFSALYEMRCEQSEKIETLRPEYLSSSEQLKQEITDLKNEISEIYRAYGLSESESAA